MEHKEKKTITRKQRDKHIKVSRKALKSAMKTYLAAGGTITMLDDYRRGSSLIIAQNEDYSPVHYGTSKSEVTEITDKRRM